MTNPPPSFAQPGRPFRRRRRPIRRTAFLPTVAGLCIDMMLNAAAAALAGAAHPDGVAVARVVREMGGNGRSTIIGMGQRTSPVYAALVNGTLVRLLDYDDNTVDTGNRPSAAVFPAVMALGEMHGYSGQSALSAFAAGCEISARLSADAETRAFAGAVGAAAAAAMLLGLDENGLSNAAALAAGAGDAGVGYQAAGSGALAGGRSAMHGVMAALMAAEKITAPLTDTNTPPRHSDLPLNRHSDLPLNRHADLPLNRHSGESRNPLADLGPYWRLIDPGLTIRLYPCHPASHGVIDAALGSGPTASL